MRHKLQNASGGTALYVTVTLLPAQRMSYTVQSCWCSCMHFQESSFSYNLLQCIINQDIVVLADTQHTLISCLCRTTIPGAIDVVFCSDQSADSWIVREVETIRREGKVPHVRLCPQTISCCVTPFSLCQTGNLNAVMKAALTFDTVVYQSEHQA